MVMRYDYVTALCPGGSSKKLPKGPSKRTLTLFPFPSVPANQNAILVWGLWTAKSSLLYPHGGTKSLARDYALLLFSKNLNVHSSDVNVRVELDTPVRNCLNIFVLERSDLTGNSELPDESFKILYPNIFGSILPCNDRYELGCVVGTTLAVQGVMGTAPSGGNMDMSLTAMTKR
ncbi:hypothetical protein JHK82_031974 [Glycine max]|nr:hypothetical protein JHK85_032640 [Glycine max]KAG4995244.1 hypothetical protein JHK86_032071 [Glycine max]KAG5125237.1 hypothetical protein JHK82_031974 [Glycine max]KAG5146662.1 hypothetical protein JHK84_032205 [Glycine max]